MGRFLLVVALVLVGSQSASAQRRVTCTPMVMEPSKLDMSQWPEVAIIHDLGGDRLQVRVTSKTLHSEFNWICR